MLDISRVTSLVRVKRRGVPEVSGCEQSTRPLSFAAKDSFKVRLIQIYRIYYIYICVYSDEFMTISDELINDRDSERDPSACEVLHDHGP